MNIYTLNALIAVLALVVTIAFGLMKKPDNWLLYYVRNFLGTFFIFSGVVKAIDPLGTAFKMKIISMYSQNMLLFSKVFGTFVPT